MENENDNSVVKGKHSLLLGLVKANKWTSLIVATVGIAGTLTIWLFPDAGQYVVSLLSSGA